MRYRVRDGYVLHHNGDVLPPRTEVELTDEQAAAARAHLFAVKLDDDPPPDPAPAAEPAAPEPKKRTGARAIMEPPAHKMVDGPFDLKEQEG